jgi:hypothetical protein
VEVLYCGWRNTDLRDIEWWQLRLAESGEEVRLFTLHLKASQGSDNEQRRLLECIVLRNYLDTLPEDLPFIVAGDLNVYWGSEPAYELLLSEGPGQLHDPIDQTGYWHNSITYAPIHTPRALAPARDMVGEQPAAWMTASTRGHVSVEVSSGIITAVAVSQPGEADGAQVQPLLEQTKETTQSPVAQALGDCAYSTRDSISGAHKAGVEMVTKMPSPPKKRYGPEAFEVRVEGREARCPSRSSCTQVARRSLSVPPEFHERRERERYARSPEGREVVKRRVVVEHGIGRLKNLGAGRARYFGRARTRAQWLWSAAVANLSLLWGGHAAQDGCAAVA